MKVRPKYFNYEDLPCIHCKDKLMKAAPGGQMSPGPRFPGMKGNMQALTREVPRELSPQMPQRVYDPSAIISTSQLPPIDTNKIKPNVPPPPKKDSVTPHQKGQKFNAASAALLAGQALNMMLAENPNRQTVVQPQMAYNPLNYGTGSQGLYEHGGFIPMANYGYYVGEDENNTPSARSGIYIKPSKRGTLHDALGIPRGQKIPASKLKDKPGDSPALKKKKLFARNARTWKHDDGGIVPFLFQGMEDLFGNVGDAAEALVNPAGALGGATGAASGVGASAPLPIGKDGKWIQKAVNPKHKGYCTPMTKSTCTPRRKALAKTFKKHHGFHEDGGYVQNYPESDYGLDQYYKYGGKVGLGNWSETDRNDAMSMLTGDMEHGGAIDPMQNDPYTMINSRMDIGGFIAPGWDRYKIGGVIPDNMSAFNPHRYAHGGNVNGSAHLNPVDARFPNADMMEQWLLYAYGGSVNGEAKIREVGDRYPNSDLMEQWLLYKNGGELSPGKAKEMLRDGTANGKKLTAKQKRYFGMVAGGKAQSGADIAFVAPETGDPKPKKKAPATPPAARPTTPVTPRPASPSTTGLATNTAGLPVYAPGMEVNWNSRRLKNSGIDQDAYDVDQILGVLGNNYDPFNKEGAAYLRNLRNPEFAQRAGLRIKQLQQSNPNYSQMTPEQRINLFYNSGGNGSTDVDEFIRRTKSFGGNPAAFWQNHAGNYNRWGMRNGGYLDGYEPMAAARQRYMRNGGVMYEDGGQLDTMWGGDAELESYNPYDGGMVAFNGASHDDGGIGMHYNGTPIEVEGGEFASKDAEGNLNIYGNMYIPGTRTKFKAAAGAIAKKEKRYDMLKTKGSDLVNKANPANRFDQLRFNAGQVMMNGGEMGQQDLASKKESLASLQRDMLDMASMNGIDPYEMSKGKIKKAKGGAYMANGGSDPDGNDPTRADRNKNPGNIKYGEFAKKYGAKRDKDGFAIFPDRQTGEKAMHALLTSPAYKNMSAKDAIYKWTGKHPYRYDLGPLTDKKVGEMNPDELSIMMGTMTKGEGTRYGLTPRPVPGTPSNTPRPNVPTPTTPFTPYRIPDVPVDAPGPEIDPIDPVPGYDWLDVPPEKRLPSNVEPLGLNNVLGEAYALATNRPEPVPAQRYEPQLFVPYQVSFQDRLNANQSVFNAQQRAVGASNPAALGTLGAQKYAADQNVLADEFRTNQAISNDITNKNIALVNDANMKNLGIADTQMVRQSTARSKTRELNQMILNSLSDKYAKNDLENKRLAAYENLYDYRFVPTDDGGLRAQYMGPNAYFNYEGKNSSNKPEDVRTISRYDAQGNLKGYAEFDESALKEEQRRLDIEMKRRKLPKMPNQPLSK